LVLHWKIVFNDCSFADATVGIAVDAFSHVTLAHEAALACPFVGAGVVRRAPLLPRALVGLGSAGCRVTVRDHEL
jgi:hypothetical protein